MARRDLLIELGIVVIAIFAWFFIATNVSPTLGNIYSALTVGAIIAIFVDLKYGKKDIRLINKSISWTKAIIIALISYIILIVSTQFTAGIAKVIPLTELLGSLAASAPVYANSVPLNFIVFGILVAYIESFAIFQALLDLLSSMFRVPINKQNLFNPKLILIILGITLFFIFLHVTVRGLSTESEADLILVGIMAFISLVLIVIYQEGRIPILFHVISNIIASTVLFTVV